MKHFIFSLLFSCVAMLATAQVTSNQAGVDKKQLEARADEITLGMAKQLQLTPEQTKKLKTINLKSMVYAENVKIKYKAEPQELIKQMDIISQTRLSKIKDLLTPHQFQLYQQRREEKMGVPKEAQTYPKQSGGYSPLNSYQNSY